MAEYFLAAVSILLASCFHDDDGGGDVRYVTGNLTLTAPDKPDVLPCPNQDILTIATELTALQDALTTGTLSFLDVPFDVNDADNFKKKCGFETFWDPVNNINEVPEGVVGGPPVTLSKLLTLGNAGICTANSTPLAPLDGFPVSGIYRAARYTAGRSS